jgi:hypothetical protein
MSCSLWYSLSVGSNANGSQVLKAVAKEKELDDTKRESATMYVEDLAEYARVLLATREMTFKLGWLRI